MVPWRSHDTPYPYLDFLPPRTRPIAIELPHGRVKHFVRHYLEMVVAMFAGMAVLGLPAGWALGALGCGWRTPTTPRVHVPRRWRRR